MSSSTEELLGLDHEALDKLLSRVFVALDAVDSVEVFRHLDLFWARLAMHIRAENLQLFPALSEAETAQGGPTKDEVSEAIVTLGQDHNFFMKQLSEAIKIVRDREFTADEARTQLQVVRELLSSIRARMVNHNRLEEELIYRLPAQVLTASQQSKLAERVKKELDNLPQRFQ